ncbi:hypothetical protein EPI10_031589 [Gossypium australe]|uniref:Uncharacterized protein n=1 Tax=Gossypium australe TaxID=47621 RepID=A0A5B6X3C0_9ROSI|nr:hypothetical protein EPI10_031589 [Gossypium australe]
MMGDIKRQIGIEESLEAEDEPGPEEVTTGVAEIVKEITKDSTGAKILFTSRLEEKQKQHDEEFVSFLNLFKTLNVNLPLIELIEKVPKYAKFLKEIMSTHRKIKIGSIYFNRGLCDLGASINLMPLSVFEKLDFIIPADFVVFDFGEDRKIPILLGRHFLATSRSTIDLEKSELTMKINGEIETFKCGHQLSEEGWR